VVSRPPPVDGLQTWYVDAFLQVRRAEVGHARYVIHRCQGHHRR